MTRRFHQTKQWETAGRCCEQGLALDPLREELYRMLMQVLQDARRPAEALCVYQRCRTALGTGLGIEPSAETEALRGRVR